MTLDKKYRLTYMKLGEKLIQSGIGFKRKAFFTKDRDIRVFHKTYLNNLIEGLGFEQRPAFADSEYKVADIESMKEIIEYDYTDKKDYIKNLWDCDDYAQAFRVFTGITYGINSIALAKHIKIIIDDTRASWHRACIFPATEGNKVNLYFLEAQNDKIKKLASDKPFKIGNWEYWLNHIEF